MKLFFLISLFILFNNCSFDSQSGIWKNEDIISAPKNNQLSDLKKFSVSQEKFEEIIIANEKTNFNLTSSFDNQEWTDIYYSKSNSLINFLYNDKNEIEFISKKLSNKKLDKNLLFKKNFYITNDLAGNIITVSNKEKITYKKYNFYKKKYKKIKKKLNIIVHENILYVADNLGYLYAYNYLNNSITWAKNHKVPFRSNLKIVKNQLIVADQDNNLIFFDKNNGSILKLLPTEGNILKNEFVNSLSLSQNNLFFLNSFGSLYAIDLENMEINWFLNLNKSIDNNPSKLFFGNQIINIFDKVFVSSNQNSYIVDAKSGTIISEKNFSTKLRPIVINNKIFLITKNNFLICLNFNTGDIVYSYNLKQILANFLETKGKKLLVQNFLILNNKIYIFLNNSYIIKVKINGDLVKLVKLPSKLNSNPVIINKSIVFTNNKNKLVVIN